MNQDLMCKFEEWEVVQALKQMAPMKAPGPDGMPLLFFQHFQPMIKGDVTHSVLSWLNSGTLANPVNHTFITLIPKKKNPSFVLEYRPISLCNVLYKIFSKVHTNRLKNSSILSLLSTNQFLPKGASLLIISLLPLKHCIA